MIHHFSIAVHDPEKVAHVLAEIFDGHVSHYPYGGGTWIAWVKDKEGTAVEIFPFGIELEPDENDGPAQFRKNDNPSSLTATHAAISVKCDREKLHEIAAREDWKITEQRRGRFGVIEVWIENRFMIEFMTPEMAEEYRNATATAIEYEISEGKSSWTEENTRRGKAQGYNMVDQEAE